jgi:hypothetical protein
MTAMTFRDAIDNTPELKGSCQPGIHGLANADRARLRRRGSTPTYTGSVNLDTVLGALPGKPYANAAVWDYAVGLRPERKREHAVWIEVHPAASAHAVDEVSAKAAWLKAWLQRPANADLAGFPRSPLPTEPPRPFVWVASGKVTIQRHAPQLLRLAKAGVRFAGEHLSL